jgi:hypothetical protein
MKLPTPETHELGFEDSSDVASWDQRASFVRDERPTLWLYAACGTASVILGLMSSRVLISLVRARTPETPQLILPTTAFTAPQSTPAISPVPRTVARNRFSAPSKRSHARASRSWELSTPEFSTSADAPTRPFDHDAEPDMNLMDVPSSPMERRALAESGHNASCDLQHPCDPLAKLELLQDSAAAFGTLRINSRPWAQVYIDNQPVGTTPVLSLTVRTGPHIVQLVNQEFKMSKVLDVDVGPGERVTRVVSLDE